MAKYEMLKENGEPRVFCRICKDELYDFHEVRMRDVGRTFMKPAHTLYAHILCAHNIDPDLKEWS